MEQFGVAREQLQRKVEADPTDPFLVTALAYADLALGRKEDSIHEGKRAMAKADWPIVYRLRRQDLALKGSIRANDGEAVRRGKGFEDSGGS
jgi:hypothetical protein